MGLLGMRMGMMGKEEAFLVELIDSAAEPEPGLGIWWIQQDISPGIPEWTFSFLFFG